MTNLKIISVFCYILIMQGLISCDPAIKTDNELGLPILTTSEPTSVSAFTATCGGVINSDGGKSITARGVCWATTESPSISINTYTINGTGTGTFISYISGLSSTTKYYIRAYATNANGTAYGPTYQINTPFGKAIGDLYLGGKIAYLDKSGIHGFVCSISEESAFVPWWNGNFITTGATNSILETSGVYGITKSGGRKNTDAIIAAQGPGTYAASICAALTTGGATAGDWYLPSQGELSQINANKSKLGGFGRNKVWSSTESGLLSAWYIYASYSSDVWGDKYAKNFAYCVRAVRAF